MELKECAHCGFEYPPEILSSMQGSLITGPICGICALDIINSIQGITRTSFSGNRAEAARQAAINWRYK